MSFHPDAGKPAKKESLINLDALLAAYTDMKVDHESPGSKVSFGTSGHRGTSINGSFNEGHILAITQAICEYRKQNAISGPLFLGRDTHALSIPAERSALEVLLANGVITQVAEDDGATPTPVISNAILSHNRDASAKADGIVITPSHNPPQDGGFKYNPPHGGPADSDVTYWIEKRANAILSNGLKEVVRMPYQQAQSHSLLRKVDFISNFVEELDLVVNMDAIRSSGLSIGADPLGGASLDYWQRIAEHYKLNLEVVNTTIDPSFSFMTLDHDGVIRMDCSSPHAMASLISLKEKYDIAFGNDPDADRHGIVTRSMGLLNPNHYLAVCIHYLFQNRSAWPKNAAVGKTLVSSSIIDRVANSIGRKMVEVPVGFKWFVPGLIDGSLGFGGEESAGASFLRHDGTPWSTDKDGIILNLLACEMIAMTGKDPGETFEHLAAQLGRPYYRRVDQAITLAQKEAFKKLDPEHLSIPTLAGEAVTAILTRAPGNAMPIGGIKVTTENGWFAARPSGTENIYKLYAESMQSDEHLQAILKESGEIVSCALK